MINKKISTVAGIIIILAIVGAISISFLISNKQKEGVQNNVVLNSSELVNKGTAIGEGENKEIISNKPFATKEIGENHEDISIVNWRLYTNEKTGLSISYPSSWLSDSVDGLSFYVKETKKPTERHPSFGNVLSANENNMKNVTGDYFINISVYKDKGLQSNLKEWRKYDGSNYQDILIKGNQAIKFENVPHINQSGQLIAGSLRYYFIDKNNNGYEITIWYKDTSNGIGEKIISTLNF